MYYQIDKEINKNYKSKYLKYKNKYISLQNKLNQQKGGNNNIKINMQPRKYNRNNKSFNIISNHLERDSTQYLSWELWNKVKLTSPSEYNMKNDSIYQKKEYQLFSMEDFMNSDWSFLDKLLKQYQSQFDTHKWYNNNKLTLDEFDNGSNYPVYVQRLKVDDPTAKFCIIGDIHSSLHSFISIMESIKQDYFQEGNDMILLPNRYILFLGDILDRGPYNMEVLFLALGLKHKNFNNVIIMDGNHEDHYLFQLYDTIIEYEEQFKDKSNVTDFIDSKINKILNRLCTCLYLEFNGKRYHLSHGAFDSHYAGFKDGKEVPEDKNFHLETDLYKFLESNNDFCLLDKNNSSTNYKWGDFNNEISETKISSRGSDIFEYSVDLTREYITRFKISNIFTGHQDCEPINFLIDKENNKHNMVKSQKYNLYQPNELESFSLSDTDFLALTTSTATIPRNMSVEGVYIELNI
jgi:hypothetical protein